MRSSHLHCGDSDNGGAQTNRRRKEGILTYAATKMGTEHMAMLEINQLPKGMYF